MDIRIRWVVGASLLWVMTQAQAQEVETGITAGARLEWTDNARLEENNRREDLLEILDLGAYLNHAASWYDFQMNYKVSHETYERDTFDATTYYNGNASLDLLLIPARFDWLFSVASETTLIQSTEANTPNNRDQRNMYSTTPQLYIISLDTDKVALQGNATKVDFRETEQSDSDRTGANLIWAHALSLLTMFNAAAGVQKVNFEEVEDYESKTYQLGFTRTINGGSIQVGAGQTEIVPENSDSRDGANYRIILTWTNEIHTINFSAFQDLTDSTVGLSGGFDFSQSITPSEVSTGDVDLVTRTRYSLTDRYALSRTFTATGNLYFDDEKSETSEQDTIRKGGYINLAKELADNYTLSFDFNYEHSNEKLEDIAEIIRRYRILLARRFGESVRCTGWVGREQSQSGDIGGANYEEHTVGLSLTAQF